MEYPKNQGTHGKKKPMSAKMFFGGIGAIIVGGLVIVGVWGPEPEKADPEVARAYAAEGAAQKLITRNLNDPSSLQWDHCSRPDAAGVFGCTFRAKNAFGALVLQTVVFEIDGDSVRIAR